MKFSKKEFETLSVSAIAERTSTISEQLYECFAYFGMSLEDYKKNVVIPSIEKINAQYNFDEAYDQLLIKTIQTYLKELFLNVPDKEKTILDMIGTLTGFEVNEAISIVRSFHNIIGIFPEKERNDIFEHLLESNSALNKALRLIFESQKSEILEGRVEEIFDNEISTYVIKYCDYYAIGIGYDNDGLEANKFRIKYPEYLDTDTQTDLAVKARGGDIDSRNILIASNGRLVINIAKYYVNRGILMDDLIQEGTMGMIASIKTYDETKGCFSTHATSYIKKYIKKIIAEQSRTVRIPLNRFNQMSVFIRTCNSFYLCNGRDPNEEELQAILGWQLRTIRIVSKLCNGDVSLNQSIGPDKDMELGVALPDKLYLPPEEEAIQKTIVDNIYGIYDKLSPRQKEIFVLLTGYNDGILVGKTEASKMLGVKRQAVDNNLKRIRSVITGSESGKVEDSNLYNEALDEIVRETAIREKEEKTELESKSIIELIIKLRKQLPEIEDLYFELFIRQRGLNNGFIMSKNELKNLFELDVETMRNAIRLVETSISKNEKAKNIYQIIMKKREMDVKEFCRGSSRVVEATETQKNDLLASISSHIELSSMDKGIIALRFGLFDGYKRSIPEIAVFYERPYEIILERLRKITSNCYFETHLIKLCDETKKDKSLFKSLSSFIVFSPVTKKEASKRHILDNKKTA